MVPPPPAGPDPAIEVCAGCGAVLAPVTGTLAAHPGASASCTRLFDVTLLGLREEAAADVTAAATIRLADAAYDAQHPDTGNPDRLPAALDRLAAHVGAGTGRRRSTPPTGWTTTIADVAADLDVIDLGVLVGSWAHAVHADWTGPEGDGRKRYSSHP